MPKPAPKAPKAPRLVAAKTGLPTRTKPKGQPPDRGEQARAFACAAAASLEGNKCQDVLVLDLRGRSQITDFFVIASGSSDRQMHSAAEHVAELAEGLDEALYRSNLDESRANWIVLDFVDVVVHVFMPESRRYYDLEMLWGDAPRVEWKEGVAATPGGASKRNRAGLTNRDVLPGRGKG